MEESSRGRNQNFKKPPPGDGTVAAPSLFGMPALGEVPREGPKRLGAGVADELAEAYEKLWDSATLGATELLVAGEALGRALAEIAATTAARLRTSSGITVSLLQ
jgi:hypothetical protein